MVARYFVLTYPLVYKSIARFPHNNKFEAPIYKPGFESKVSRSRTQCNEHKEGWNLNRTIQGLVRGRAHPRASSRLNIELPLFQLCDQFGQGKMNLRMAERIRKSY